MQIGIIKGSTIAIIAKIFLSISYKYKTRRLKLKIKHPKNKNTIFILFIPSTNSLQIPQKINCWN